MLNQSRKRARLAQKFEDTKTAIANNGDKSTESHNGHTQNEDVNQETPVPESSGTGLAENVEPSVQSNSSETSKSMTSRLTGSNLQDKIKNFLRTEIKNPADKTSEPDAASKINNEYYLDDEYTDHFMPLQVDTSDVAGELVQVKSQDFLQGLHFVILKKRWKCFFWIFK